MRLAQNALEAALRPKASGELCPLGRGQRIGVLERVLKLDDANGPGGIAADHKAITHRPLIDPHPFYSRLLATVR